MSTFLVLGASGTVGSELTRLLESAGHSVRRASSRADESGSVKSGLAYLNLATGDGINDAIDGVDGVFLLSPPGFTNQDEILGPVIDAATQHGVQKVVLMTAMGADGDPNGAMRKTELQLEHSGLTWNVIRPNWFMQNFHTYWMGGIQQANAIQLPTGDARGSFIDARDIAAVASVLLQTATFDNRAFDLTGAESLNHHEVAAILSRETGRPIGYQDVSPETMRSALLTAGLPAGYAEFMLVILGYFKLGYSERVTDAVQQITGQSPRRFLDYARDYRTAFTAHAAV